MGVLCIKSIDTGVDFCGPYGTGMRYDRRPLSFTLSHSHYVSPKLSLLLYMHRSLSLLLLFVLFFRSSLLNLRVSRLNELSPPSPIITYRH